MCVCVCVKEGVLYKCACVSKRDSECVYVYVCTFVSMKMQQYND